MRRNLIFTIAAVSTLFCAAQTTTESATDIAGTNQARSGAKTLTLSRQKCIEIALQDNPQIKIANLEVKRIDYSKKENLASLFPQIDFSVNYQRAIELQTINMNMGGKPQSIKMGMDNSWNMGFSATLPIISAQLWKSIQISDTQILQNLESARASKLNLVDQVNQAYFSLLLAKASYDVVKDNYEIAKYNADVYAKQFEAGAATEYDVLRTSVQVKNVEPELLQAEIAIKQCKLQLKVLMGISDDVDIEPNTSLKDMQSEMDAHVLNVDRSLADNTQLRSMDLQTKMAQQNVTLKKFAWIPTVGMQFSLYWNALSNGNPLKNQKFNPYSNVALTLSVPVFSGGSKLYGLRQAQVQLNELRLQREDLINSLNMQVDLALDNINKQRAQISSNEQGVAQAQKAYQIMQKSFDIGAATYLNLRDSELANTTAKLTYYQSIYNYLISASQLDLLLGKEASLKGALSRY